MPNIVTHMVFAREMIRDVLEPRALSIVEKDQQLFEVGSNGPDYLFFHDTTPRHVMKKSKIRQVGTFCHRRDVNAFYQDAIATIRNEKDESIAQDEIIYVMGHLCHWALDSVAHPYIFYRTGSGDKQSQFRHHRIESLIDAAILKIKHNQTIEEFKAYEICNVSMEQARAITRIYHSVAKNVYGIDEKPHEFLQALNDWHFVQKLLHDGNGKKIWWICPIGHEYKSTILNRTKIRGNGNNCPICDARRHTSFSEQAVFYYLKKYFPDTINRFSANFLGKFEIDIYIPSLKVALEYDGKAWHTEKIFERDMRKYAVCKENKIKLIRLKEIKKESDCKTCDIVLYTFWEHETLNKTIIDLLDMLNIQDTNIDVDIERDKFKITKLMDNEYAESFGYKYPNLVKEWHPTKNLPAVPTMFASGTQFKVWWVCPDCGNVYQARIVSRVNGTGCPKCARHRFLYNKCKKVAKLDLKTNEVIEVYDSITDAAKSCGLRSSSNITSVCKGTKTSIGGFGWKYI